jgi:hypothetical protein
MNLKEIVWILVVVFGVGLLVVFFPKMQLHSTEETPVPEIDVVNESFSAGAYESIQINAFFQQGIESIEFEGMVFDCGKQQNCFAEFPVLFDSAGTKQIAFTVFSVSGSFELKKTVKVFDSRKKCLDGTVFGFCSDELMFCDNGDLVSDCSECGCFDGFECIENNCVWVSPDLNFEIIEFSDLVGSGRSLLVSVLIKNNSLSSIPEGTSLTAKLLKEGSEISSLDFSFSALAEEEQSTQMVFSLPELTTEESMFSIEFIYAGQSLGLIELGEVQVLEENGVPPSAPINLNASIYGNAVDLSWTESDSRTVYFRVYKSINVTEAFISYGFVGETASISFSFDSVEEGNNYFVVTAVDVFGLESDYSEPVMVEN